MLRKLMATAGVGMCLVTAANSLQAQPPRERGGDREGAGQREDRPQRDRPAGERRQGERRGPGQRGPGGPGGPWGPGGPGGPEMIMRMLPVMSALDPDHDGVISAEELAQATENLKKLDKNQDGKLTREELRPDFEGGRPPQFGGPDGPRGLPDATAEQMIARIMEADKDNDGKLSREEIPERMAERMSQLDQNEDGFVDREELQVMVDRMQQMRRGGRPGDAGEERPQPSRPRRDRRPPVDDDSPSRDRDAQTESDDE